MNRESKAEIAALLAKNASDEYSAKKGYIELAERMAELGCPQEHIDAINEISGDEGNHALTEMALLAYYDPNVKIAEDAWTKP